MKRSPEHHTLTRRERQIMDSIYRRGAATAAEVLTDLPDPPSYSAVRAMLRKLEAKGHVTHEQDGARYVYRPRISPERARASALERLVRTFFDGSPKKTVAALLDLSARELAEEDLEELARMIEDTRRRGR